MFPGRFFLIIILAKYIQLPVAVHYPAAGLSIHGIFILFVVFFKKLIVMGKGLSGIPGFHPVQVDMGHGNRGGLISALVSLFPYYSGFSLSHLPS